MTVDWPAQLGQRTPTHERTRNNNFEVSLSSAFSKLETQLDRLGVDDYRYSFDAQTRQRDGRPYSDAHYDDPGFVLRWTLDGDQYAVGCDAYSRFRDNVRTVGLYVEEKRMMEKRPVATGEAEFSNLRLPSGEEDTHVTTEAEAYDILNLQPGASPAVIREAWRQRVKEVHPDSGGDQDAYQRVMEARGVLLDG